MFVFVPETIETQYAATLDSLSVGGRVEFANILAGAGGQIGNIRVKGNWIASNIAAGIAPGADGFYGTADDQVITGGPAGQVATIKQIVIEGDARGTPTASNPAGHYGFVAQEVQSVMVDGVSFALMPGPGNDDLQVGTIGDLRIHEVS